MINDITSDSEDGMKKAVDSFKRDLQKIRTGRANTAMLDGIKVDYYGTPTPVNQVATVQVVDARLITVKPWEKNMVAVIDKTIRASDLGINPVSDSELVRLPTSPEICPPLFKAEGEGELDASGAGDAGDTSTTTDETTTDETTDSPTSTTDETTDSTTTDETDTTDDATTTPDATEPTTESAP